MGDIAEGVAEHKDMPTDVMSALVTEHFVLQSAASTTVGEASGRAALYLSTLSSSLVAMGFAAQSPGLLGPLAAVVLPAIVVMGVFTTVRLVDTGVQNLTFLAGIARIRGLYRSMDPHAAKYFTPWGAAGASEATQALASLAVHQGRLVGFGTTASMVAAINAIVAGAGVGLAAQWLMGQELLGAAIALGILTLISALALFYTYQNRRYRQFEQNGDNA
jgi:hypothetical protein